MFRILGGRSRFGTFLVLAAMVAGCGASGPAASSGGGGGDGSSASSGGSNATTGADSSDMCTLLTSSEVQAATGLTVTGSGPGDFDAAHYCEWQLEPGTNVEGVAFKRLVAISKYAGATSYDLAAPGASPVPGIGDKAFTIDNTVNVLKGDVHFAVIVILHQPGDEDQTLLNKEEQVSEELAKEAAGRL
jgi:hypothetical protein